MWNCGSCGAANVDMTEVCARCDVPQEPKLHPGAGHSCDECAWAARAYEGHGESACRRVSWGFSVDDDDAWELTTGIVWPGTPACPAFIPKGGADDDN